MLGAGRSAFFKDPGTFWHITTGQLILSKGFIRTDPYTFTFANEWWVPYQWLGEVVMALVHQVSGFDTQLLGAVTLIALVFAWLAARLSTTGLHPVIVGALVALALAGAGSHFHVRPHLFTLASMALVTVLLTQADAPRPRLPRLIWLVPYCVIWTNIHGGVLGGIGTIWLVFSGWVLFWRLGRAAPLKSWRDAGLLALIAVGCGLGTLVSPYGLDMLKTWRDIMGAPELREIIAEHRPLDVRAPYSWPVLGLLFVYAFVLLGVKRVNLRVTWLLPIVWFGLTLSRCRHAPLFAVVTLVTLTAMWKQTRWALWLAAYRADLYQPGSAIARPWWAAFWLPVALVLVALLLQAAHVPAPLIGVGWAKHDPNYWPVEVIDVLKVYEPLPGDRHNRLFNSGYIDGGFVIYHAPGYKVFVDDRCELFRGPWLKDFVAAQDAPGAALAKWDVEYRGPFDFALTRSDSAFDDWFRTSPEWEMLKRTDTATFYKHK
jgi:hypothetical protein